jgi:hypothetical protein
LESIVRHETLSDFTPIKSKPLLTGGAKFSPPEILVENCSSASKSRHNNDISGKTESQSQQAFTLSTGMGTDSNHEF